MLPADGEACGRANVNPTVAGCASAPDVVDACGRVRTSPIEAGVWVDPALGEAWFIPIGSGTVAGVT